MSDPMSQAVETVTNAIPRMEDLYQQIKAKANSGITGAITGFVLGPLGKSAMNAVIDKVEGVIDDFKEVLLERGHAQDLRGAAGEWNALVLNNIRDKAGALDPDKDTIGADDNWTGPARDAYLAATRGQRENLKGVGGVVEELGKILNDTASAHQTYWIAIAATATGFVGSLITAAAATAFPPAAAAAVAAALVAGAALATALTAFENSLKDKMNSMEAQKTQLNQILGDGGTWPKAVNDNAADPRSLSDASVTDGDASDWVPVP